MTLRERMRLARTGQALLAPYIMAGDPDLATTGQLARELVAAGADVLELGLPFSDPLADGPEIQAAGQRALEGGFRLSRFWPFLEWLLAEIEVPVLLMTYYNPILQTGPARFVEATAQAGAAGLIVPDLPLEESADLESLLRGRQMELIPLLTPVSSLERIEATSRRNPAFIYCVSTTGTTGVRESLPPGLADFIGRMRSVTELPLGLGFGIGTPEQAAAAATLVDAVIVGSAVIRAVRAEGGDAPGLIQEMKKAMEEARRQAV